MSCEDSKECCHEKAMHRAEEKLMAINDAQASLATFGFEAREVSETVGKFSPAVIGLLLEGLRAGFAKDWLLALLDKAGNAGLAFILDLVNQKQMAAVGPQFAFPKLVAIEGVPAAPEQFGGIMDGDLVQMLITKYLPQIIKQYGPQLLQQYGQQLIQMLVDLLEGKKQLA